MQTQGVERRPGVILGTPTAVLLTGVVCLLIAGSLPILISYSGNGYCTGPEPFHHCSNLPLQYVAYPLLYVGWLLVVVGACSLVFAIVFGRSRPSPGIMSYDQLRREPRRTASTGVEEPVPFPPRREP